MQQFVIIVYHDSSCGRSILANGGVYMIRTLCDKVCQIFFTVQWFSTVTPVS